LIGVYKGSHNSRISLPTYDSWIICESHGTFCKIKLNLILRKVDGVAEIRIAIVDIESLFYDTRSHVVIQVTLFSPIFLRFLILINQPVMSIHSTSKPARKM